MTHDELLAKIDKQDHAILISGIGSEMEVLRLMTFRHALRAVIELHKPNSDDGKTCQAHEQCWGCGEWGGSDGCDCNAYPCTTIQAITKELK